MLTQALVHYAWAATYAGDWEAAARAGAEAASLAGETRQPQFGLTGQLVAALAAALRGSAAELDAMLAGPERALTAMRVARCSRPRTLPGARRLWQRAGTTTRSVCCGRCSTRPTRRITASCVGRSLLDLVEAGGRGEHAADVMKVTGELEAHREQQRAADLVCGPRLRAPAAGRRRSRRGALRRGTGRSDARLPVPAGAHAVLDWPLAASAAAEARTHAHRYATRSACSTLWARCVGANARVRSCAQPVRRSGRARQMLVTGSPHRSCRSPSSRQRACRIARSASACSFHTARSDRTCTGSFRKLGIAARAQLPRGTRTKAPLARRYGRLTNVSAASRPGIRAGRLTVERARVAEFEVQVALREQPYAVVLPRTSRRSGDTRA